MPISDWNNWTAMDSPEDLVGVVSSNTDGLFGMAVWGLLWFALFTAFTLAARWAGSSEPGKDGFLGSSLVMCLASYYMGVLEWVSIYFTVVPTVSLVIGLILISQKN